MPQSNLCEVCGNECKMMCRSGTGICSENCEKELKKRKNEREFPLCA